MYSSFRARYMYTTAPLKPSTAPLEPSTAHLEPSAAPKYSPILQLLYNPSRAPYCFSRANYSSPRELDPSTAPLRLPLGSQALYSSSGALCRYSRAFCSSSRALYMYIVQLI